MQRLYDPSAELLDLRAEVRESSSIDDSLVGSHTRSLVFLEIDKLDSGDFKAKNGAFLVFFYEEDGKNYIAFNRDRI